MKRRIWLLGAGILAGCSVLPSQPYLRRRQWPLLARRPVALPARTHGPVLLVREVQAGPGLDTRSVQWKLPDGSLHQDLYEQWAVSPAQAVEDALRRWLGASGLFSAVVAPGSRLPADLILEAELTDFIGDPPSRIARVSLALVLLNARASPVRVLLAKTETGTAPLPAAQPATVVAALRTALDAVLAATEAAIASAAHVMRA